MHFYTHNIGDHLREASHLSMIEEGALLRLRDRYASSEKPLPKDLAALNRLVCARSSEEQEAVKTVLYEFFKETEEGWRCPFIDKNIHTMNDISEKRRSAANRRWRGGGDMGHAIDHADEVQLHSECNATQNPEANTQNRRTQAPKTSHTDQPSADLTQREQSRLNAALVEFWKLCPRKKSDQYGLAKEGLQNAIEAVGWSDLEVIMAKMRAYAAKVEGSEPRYIKLPHNWLNGRCWEDEY